ncbi:MAG: menaquinone-dependent protoporphyrinogen IX dehydrogenase [Candidatus Symbiodolus clandestinus]
MNAMLLLYSSRNGHTQHIIQKVAQYLGEQGIDCDVADLHCLANPEWQQYQQVIVGASIRYGNFHPLLWRFVRQHSQALNQRKTAFFCVSLVARKASKCTLEGNPYLRKFLKHSPWQPTLCKAFAGALRYPHYRWFERRIIQLIMALTGGETDVTQEIVYTEWQHVDNFARQCAEKLCLSGS